MDFEDVGMFVIVWTMVIITVGLLSILFVGIPLMVYDSMGEECNFRSNSILKSVNGVEDIDTGLFSGGTIKETTLLFSGGLVTKFQSYELRDIELVIGKKYRINKCTNNGGRLSYEIKRFVSQEKPVQ